MTNDSKISHVSASGESERETGKVKGASVSADAPTSDNQPVCRDCNDPISEQQHKYSGRCARCQSREQMDAIDAYQQAEREACNYHNEGVD